MKRLFLVLCLLPILIASSENEEFKSIMVEIKSDISYSKSELKKLKPLFQEEYETIGKPGIKQLRFSDLTIHERMTGSDDQEVMIISTNSARVMGNSDYTKPHIYVLEKNSASWKITLKEKDINESQLEFYFLSSPAEIEKKVKTLGLYNYSTIEKSKIFLSFSNFSNIQKKLSVLKNENENENEKKKN